MPNQFNEEDARLEHLRTIENAGIEPYPSKTKRKDTLEEARKSNEKTVVKTAGRIISKREMGKLCFCHLKDESGKFSLLFPKKNWEKNLTNFLLKILTWGILWKPKEKFSLRTKARLLFL
jgi:lysyl-tRNA synthetase class 2